MKKEEIVEMLKNSAYHLWRASLCAGPPHIADLFNELKDPKVGDIVAETSTMWRGGNVLESVGMLISITREPMYTLEDWKKSGASDGEAIPLETVYALRLVFDDNREFRWRNASFIKVKAGR
jgi:hypothetical protein